MRPRPVVVLEGRWSFDPSVSMEDHDSFTVRNIGSSPAFDIKISEIRGPMTNKTGQHVGTLITASIYALGEKDFDVTYAGLDKKRLFKTECRMKFDFSADRLTAMLEPRLSWLGEERE